jgi:predicted nucleotide-binding protein
MTVYPPCEQGIGPMTYNRLKNIDVLVVEDDPSMLERLCLNLESVGCKPTRASSVVGAERAVEDTERPFVVAVIDLYIPEDAGRQTDRIMRGEELAYTIRKRSPTTRIVGLSANLQREPFTPLSDLFSGFVFKNDIPVSSSPIILFETIDGILASPNRKLPRMFIVHGHDNELLLELKDFLQNTVELGKAVVLREKASWGKTVIEKFEKEARDVDLVFVLLTPDDRTTQSPTEASRRARQNVVFEMGFFYAKMQRTSGRVFLLRKGDVELPSDIAGIVYVDVTEGIRGGSAFEEMRSALRELGWVK